MIKYPLTCGQRSKSGPFCITEVIENCIDRFSRQCIILRIPPDIVKWKPTLKIFLADSQSTTAEIEKNNSRYDQRKARDNTCGNCHIFKQIVHYNETWYFLFRLEYLLYN